MALKGVHGRDLCRRGWDTVYTWFGSQLNVCYPTFPESLGSFISYFSSLLEVSLFYFCKKKKIPRTAEWLEVVRGW